MATSGRADLEVARVSLMPPRTGAAPAALSSDVRKMLAWLRTLGALPADLEVCEIEHRVEARDSQFCLALSLKPRVQQVLCLQGVAASERTHALRRAIDHDVRSVRRALGNVALEAELATVRIQASRTSHKALAAGIENACTAAVLDMAGRSIRFVVNDEAFSVDIPGFERTFTEPGEREIVGIVAKISNAAVVLRAVEDVTPGGRSGGLPLPSALPVSTAHLDQPGQFDFVFVRSMRKRSGIAATVRATCCAISGRPIGAVLCDVRVGARDAAESGTPATGT